MQNPEKVALYDRLGGVYNVATVVDDFIEKPTIAFRRQGSSTL